jgi:UDP-N-acetylglucosamine--N-acetylmuramyl-(pentapeptide) pyrophosphoryl-undecaprenol N-acetylglucosamine transferase
MPAQTPTRIAIACGGTGGHLYPGLAVAEELARRDCSVSLLISPKEVDQQAVKSVVGMEIVTLPAVGLTGGNFIKFLRGFWKSYHEAKKFFAGQRPDAVLAMGGFTSAPPILAGKHLGAKTFLHESNTIPGRANRWLARRVDQAFVYFHAASGMLNLQKIETVGMPVREQFLEPVDSAAARMSLGLNPGDPVLLVMGGSQGATGVNKLVVESLPLLLQRFPRLQIIHLTGVGDFADVQAAYAKVSCKAVVRPFLTEMELAMGAATVAITRAGASSIAELAALRLPAVLIPYPHAADNHQYYNATTLVESGAGRVLEQAGATPERLVAEVSSLIDDQNLRAEMQKALAKWHTPRAAEVIAMQILISIGRPAESTESSWPQSRSDSPVQRNASPPLLKVQAHV